MGRLTHFLQSVGPEETLEEGRNLLDAIRGRRATSEKRQVARPDSTPLERFQDLLSSKEWNAEVRSGLLRLKKKGALGWLLKEMDLPEELVDWVRSGYFDREIAKKPPTRSRVQELRVLDEIDG